MKRNQAFALAISILAIAVALTGASKAPAPAATLRIDLVYLEGAVKVDGKAADIGMRLRPTSKVETGPGASCDIVFGEKNALRVGQNTSLTLDFSGLVKAVSIKTGGLTAVLRKLDQIAGKDSFRVTTNAAIAAVRGTSFCVWSDEDGSYVCACNGSVRTVDSSGANELDLSAAHHTARLYQKKGRTTTVQAAGVEHHSDASVESLAARIGETVDWTKVD